MTQEEKRSKIAEACGWTEIYPHDELSLHASLDYPAPSGIDPRTGARYNLPDYFNDLNAIYSAESEKELHHSQPWIERLVAIGLLESGLSMDRTDGWDWALVVVRLSVAQRAEAFGLTMGLWKEGE